MSRPSCWVLLSAGSATSAEVLAPLIPNLSVLVPPDGGLSSSPNPQLDNTPAPPVAMAAADARRSSSRRDMVVVTADHTFRVVPALFPGAARLEVEKSGSVASKLTVAASS